MAVTIVDIAKKLNVSHATVSRVLNGRNKDFISEETRQRVLNAAMEMGYQPNRMARALATGKSNLIALSLPDLSAPFYGRIIKSFQECLKRDGFDMIPFANEGTVGLKGWPVDGVAAFGAAGSVGPFLRDSVELSIPLVTMGPGYISDTDYVAVDLYRGSRDAVQHLVETGRKRIAFVAYRPDLPHAFSRRDAYLEVLSEAGMEPEIISVSDLGRPGVRNDIAQYIDAHGCPDGLFCMSDDLAIGAFRALRDCELRIPEDVALVGCDGIEDTEYIDPPISTILQPVEEVCEMTWEFLRNRMRNPDIDQQTAKLEARLEVRSSSAV